MVQVLGLGQQDAFSLCILSDDIVGLAHTLSTRLVHKNQITVSSGVAAFCQEDETLSKG